MKVSLDGGITWKEAEEIRVQYDPIQFEDDGQEIDGTLQVNCTPEGVIMDVIDNNSEFGEMCGTSSETAQEIVDRLAFNDNIW